MYSFKELSSRIRILLTHKVNSTILFLKCVGSVFSENGLEFLKIWDGSEPWSFKIGSWNVGDSEEGSTVLAVMFHSLQSFWAIALIELSRDATAAWVEGCDNGLSHIEMEAVTAAHFEWLEFLSLECSVWFAWGSLISDGLIDLSDWFLTTFELSGLFSNADDLAIGWDLLHD